MIIACEVIISMDMFYENNLVTYGVFPDYGINGKYRTTLQPTANESDSSAHNPGLQNCSASLFTHPTDHPRITSVKIAMELTVHPAHPTVTCTPATTGRKQRQHLTPSLKKYNSDTEPL
jgi:hypothetical protein